MVTITDETLRAAAISEQEMREEIAILLYQRGLPLGKAGAVAGYERFAFRRFLASRRIPVQYDVEDLKHDMRTLGIADVESEASVP